MDLNGPTIAHSSNPNAQEKADQADADGLCTDSWESLRGQKGGEAGKQREEMTLHPDPERSREKLCPILLALRAYAFSCGLEKASEQQERPYLLDS
ncbi:uncharacterized [Tachysurus ichikawai]